MGVLIERQSVLTDWGRWGGEGGGGDGKMSVVQKIAYKNTRKTIIIGTKLA